MIAHLATWIAHLANDKGQPVQHSKQRQMSHMIKYKVAALPLYTTTDHWLDAIVIR